MIIVMLDHWKTDSPSDKFCFIIYFSDPSTYNYHITLTDYNNLGRLWLAYTELQGNFYMLQPISVDSMHFTLP